MFREKKNIVRLIAFIAAVFIAVSAFTMGVLQLGHRESGYYDVGLTAEAQSVAYGSGAHLLFYAQGSSSVIRQRLNAAQKAFGDALTRAWRLLDAEKTYENVVNIASLNAHPGETLQVDPALFDVLTDALSRSERGEGYDIFSGALHAEWRTLRYLEEPEAFDPVNNADEAALLRSLTDYVGREDCFRLQLDAPDRVTLAIAPEYRDFLRDNEIEAPVLDLNLLRDAYLLDMVADQLKRQGWTQGYLYTESGCSLWLETRQSRYDLYGATGDGYAVIGALDWSSPSAFCQFSASALTEEAAYGYYALKAEGGTLLRHPCIDVSIGDTRNVVMTAALAGGEDALVDLAYDLVALNAVEDAEAAKQWLEALPEAVFAAYTLQSDDGARLWLRQRDAARVTLNESAGYALCVN